MNQFRDRATATEDLAAFIAGLGEIPYETAPGFVKQRSRDFYWYSPILKQQLDQRTADIVVQPRSESDVLVVAALCARHRIPLTMRGGGTGNYGQAVPLEGGVVLEMRALSKVSDVENGMISVGSGAFLRDIDAHIRPQGWELRLWPSTYRSATIGGFVAGGSGGIGSITYGGLREPGNLIAARIVTVEETPRILTLKGADVSNVQHAYGTNGIITELTIALTRAIEWLDVVVAFHEFGALAKFCAALAASDGIDKKLVAAMAWPLPKYFRTLAVPAPENTSLGFLMVAPSGLEPLKALLSSFGGRIHYAKTEKEVLDEKLVPAHEFCYNHTTLQVLKADKSFTYIQTGFPTPNEFAVVTKLMSELGDEMMMHLEFMRTQGRVMWSAIPVIRYSSPERVAEVIRLFESNGCGVANPHSYVIEEGGSKKTEPNQLEMKRIADPAGLMNPGKLRGWIDHSVAS